MCEANYVPNWKNKHKCCFFLTLPSNKVYIKRKTNAKRDSKVHYDPSGDYCVRERDITYLHLENTLQHTKTQNGSFEQYEKYTNKK